MTNPWQGMTLEDGRAMDDRNEKGPARFQVALKQNQLAAARP
jgi:hypothetical protein